MDEQPEVVAATPKPYHRPVLERHGTVRELTRSSGMAGVDDGSGMSSGNSKTS